jgi:hypothetical protein
MIQVNGWWDFDSTSQPEELVYGAVVNSQALHPGLGLLLGMEEASASTVSALTAFASTASSLPLILSYLMNN